MVVWQVVIFFFLIIVIEEKLCCVIFWIFENIFDFLIVFLELRFEVLGIFKVWWILICGKINYCFMMFLYFFKVSLYYSQQY